MRSGLVSTGIAIRSSASASPWRRTTRERSSLGRSAIRSSGRCPPPSAWPSVIETPVPTATLVPAERTNVSAAIASRAATPLRTSSRPMPSPGAIVANRFSRLRAGTSASGSAAAVSVILNPVRDPPARVPIPSAADCSAVSPSSFSEARPPASGSIPGESIATIAVSPTSVAAPRHQSRDSGAWPRSTTSRKGARGFGRWPKPSGAAIGRSATMVP